jgi:hypothetical protein
MKHGAKCRVIYLALLLSDEFDIIADIDSQKFLIGKYEGNKSPGDLDIDCELLRWVLNKNDPKISIGSR